ncbi:SDR family oxidoreductase [Paenibacillus amylolyticus]|uniref:NAD-dependent epimerase/dehydratase n=1 Tax=Paenibacillus amylolyticus TaxID=1451 RepID=A0A117I153_PAEAM|nr:SDR family oxidoreductase [Paenibacillus amylolyticus]GAS81677.1 NAD-dependent epimerase/dehydratase [Paenibacillus amylolyticus]
MKVFVVGSNGQIGQQLIQLLKNSEEHTVLAMVRKQEQADKLSAQGVEAVLADLEGTVDSIANAAMGCDAIVFAAGSGGTTGHDKTLLIDLDGAGKTIEAAQKADIDRFIMVSAIQANNRVNWHDNILPYYAAKHYADKVLELSGLTYTIIRPGILKNEPGTGKISAAENITSGNIAREDVAQVIMASLSEKNTYNRSFDLIAGEIAMPEALSRL